MDTMFASRSLPIHLLRGLIGFGLLAAAIALAGRGTAATLAGRGTAATLAAVALGAGAVAALRFCPTCWLIGLAQTIDRRREPHPARRDSMASPQETPPCPAA